MAAPGQNAQTLRVAIERALRDAYRRRPARIVLLAALLVAFPVSAPAGELPAEPTAAFLAALVGDWEGEAYRTPRGRLPYDVEFRRTPDARVGGVADPGAALHYWTFFQDNGHLKLRFLTTFRGNDQPTMLHAERYAEGTFYFRAKRLPHLSVTLTPHDDRIDIHVLLHEEPHVDIRLVRRTVKDDT